MDGGSKPGWISLDQTFDVQLLSPQRPAFSILTTSCSPDLFLSIKHYSTFVFQNRMDPIELLQWFEDDNEIISSLQVTTALILKMQTERKHGGS
jgi:hypothetical protein